MVYSNKFNPQLNKKHSFKASLFFLAEFLKTGKWFLIGFILVGMIYSALNLSAIFTLKIFQNLVVDKKLGAINKMGTIMLLLTLAVASFQYLISSGVIWVAQQGAKRLRIYLYAKLLRTRLNYYDQTKVGEIISKTDNDLTSAINGFVLAINQLWLNIFTMLTMMIGMFFVSVYLGLVVIVMVPIGLLLSSFFLFKTKKYIKERQANLGVLNSFLEESISGLKEIKLFNQQAAFKKEFAKLNHQYSRSAYKVDFWFSFVIPWNSFFNNLINGTVVVLGVLLIVNYYNPIGIFSSTLLDLKNQLHHAIGNQRVILENQYFNQSFVVINTFVLIARNFNNPIYQIIGVWHEVQSAFFAGQRMQTISQLPEEYLPQENLNLTIIPSDQPRRWIRPLIPLNSNNGYLLTQQQKKSKVPYVFPQHNRLLPSIAAHAEIVVNNLSFGYHPDRLVLKNINFKIKPGQVIGIVGPTGSGKSTFVNLLTKFYDLQQGDILFNGISIKKISKESWRKNISIVLQDNSLFNQTIYQNIAYGNLNATPEAVYQAAKLSGAHDFIIELKDGYQTIVSEMRNSLSEGQKQLIAIARALLSPAPLLVFDEATASVDIHTENKLKHSIANLLKYKTAFVIAHRLSTIRDADLIIVIKDGALIEQGTHQQLMAQKGFYYQLANAQTTNQFIS